LHQALRHATIQTLAAEFRRWRHAMAQVVRLGRNEVIRVRQMVLRSLSSAYGALHLQTGSPTSPGILVAFQNEQTLHLQAAKARLSRAAIHWAVMRMTNLKLRIFYSDWRTAAIDRRERIETQACTLWHIQQMQISMGFHKLRFQAGGAAPTGDEMQRRHLIQMLCSLCAVSSLRRYWGLMEWRHSVRARLSNVKASVDKKAHPIVPKLRMEEVNKAPIALPPVEVEPELHQMPLPPCYPNGMAPAAFHLPPAPILSAPLPNVPSGAVNWRDFSPSRSPPMGPSQGSLGAFAGAGGTQGLPPGF